MDFFDPIDGRYLHRLNEERKKIVPRLRDCDLSSLDSHSSRLLTPRYLATNQFSKSSQSILNFQQCKVYISKISDLEFLDFRDVFFRFFDAVFHHQAQEIGH